MVVVGVILQMLGQLTDALSEDSDLNFGGAGVALVGGVRGDNAGLDFFGDQSDDYPFLEILYPASKPRAERLPHRRHDPMAESAGAYWSIIASNGG